VLVARRFSTNKLPVEIVPPVLLITTFEALSVEILSAISCEVTVTCEVFKKGAVKLDAKIEFAYNSPVLNVLVTTVFILRYPPAGAFISPYTYILDAVNEDVCKTLVLRFPEKDAVFAVMLEILSVPPGFVITAVPSVIEDTSGP
jgi:hypothetical protein